MQLTLVLKACFLIKHAVIVVQIAHLATVKRLCVRVVNVIHIWMIIVPTMTMKIHMKIIQLNYIHLILNWITNRYTNQCPNQKFLKIKIKTGAKEKTVLFFSKTKQSSLLILVTVDQNVLLNKFHFKSINRIQKKIQ